jgi:lytic murein transglycosylase
MLMGNGKAQTAEHVLARARRRSGAICVLALAWLPLLTGCGESGHREAGEIATASVPQFAPAETSTHPLMTSQAIMQATGDFPNCLASMWPQAARRGVARATFERLTRTLEPELQIMELLDRQPEFSKPIWEYLDQLVNEKRIAGGREVVATHAAVFDAVERSYGVDRYVIAAIWGIESNFGTQAGERPVLRSTATLACVGRRQAYFRDEFLSALEIVQRGDVAEEYLKGSWAGAFGPTQFMPTSFKRYAVDFDGDGRRNIIHSIPDVIASTANNLRKDGWQAGASWGYEVVLPRNFDFLLIDSSIRKPVREWESRGVGRAGGKPFRRGGDLGHLLLPAGAHGPAFLVIENFRAIMRYNPSESYALAVGHLADRIRGGEPFVQPWPRDELPLSRGERLELQTRLAGLGLYRGDPDGQLGSRTRAAIRDFQTRAGLAPDGFASNKLLDRLRHGR